MKIYISGPITGTTDYMERFEQAEKLLKRLGYEVMNPAKVNSNMPEGTTHEEYMKMSYAMLSMCELMMLLPGWENSKGCRMEIEHAIKQGISITFAEVGE